MSTTENLKLDVPASLEAITLGQYQKYLAIVQKHQDEEGNIPPEKNEFLNLKAIEVFCGPDMKQIHKLPVKLIGSIVAQINNCFKQETVLHRTITLKAPDRTVELGFIPNLEKMTFGEYADLEQYIHDWQNMHKAMAVLYRPISLKMQQNYQIHEYEGTAKQAEIMKELPVSFALAAQLFFYHLGSKLLSGMQSYLKGEELEARLNLDLHKTGAGTVSSILSQMETSLKLMKSPQLKSIPPLHG